MTMAFKTLILALCLIGAVLGNAFSSPNSKGNSLTFVNQLPGDYDVAEPTFVGEVFGEKFAINGTISVSRHFDMRTYSNRPQEVIAELEHIHAGKNLTVLEALSASDNAINFEDDFILDKVIYAIFFF
jgi:hypothetical protein